METGEEGFEEGKVNGKNNCYEIYVRTERLPIGFGGDPLKPSEGLYKFVTFSSDTKPLNLVVMLYKRFRNVTIVDRGKQKGLYMIQT